MFNKSRVCIRGTFLMNNIAHERKKLGLTQQEFAEVLGWGQSRIGNYESNLRKPKLKDCRCIVAAFNRLGIQCTLDDIFPTGLR